jgi:hypothetical protein
LLSCYSFLGPSTPPAVPSPKKKGLNLTCWLVTLILAASVAGNLLLLRALQDSFAKLHFSRVFPLGFAAEGQAPGTGASGRAAITFWGDSRSLLWDKTPLAAGFEVLSFAHGSQTSNQLVLQLQTQPAVHTEYAIAQIGINDLHPLGALRAEKQEILQRLRQNILTIRAALLARSDIVILTTVFPPGQVPIYRRTVWDPETLQYVREINEMIRAATDNDRVILLDAHAMLSDPDSYLSRRYIDDDFFLHVNREAYARLNAELQQLLARHPPRRS